MNYSQKIGAYLAEIRKSRRLSQREVAQAADLSQSVISDGECNGARLGLNTLMQWAGALSVDVPYLLTKLQRGDDLMPLPTALEYRGRTYLLAGSPPFATSHSPAKRVESAEVRHETP